MQILSIQLKNIKSHRDSELMFSPGINVLAGPNGVGKSTVFEAVGYALFGVDARDFVSNIDRFLTIGAKRGEVAVTFIAIDGETYRATRTVGTPATWRLARQLDGLFETEDHAGAGETEERIRELLGLAKGRSLADQFKLVIGPFQSEFLGPFVLKQPTKRREAFDEILGIDSWRKTFDGTKELGRVITAKIANLETEIAGKGERVTALPERRAEVASITSEEREREKELKSVQAAIGAAASVLEELETRRTAIERLRADILQVEQSIITGKDFIQTQVAAVTEAESAAGTVEEARAGKSRFDAAEAQLAHLRESEKLRQRLERELGELELKISSSRQAAAHEEKEAAVLEEKSAADRLQCGANERDLRERLVRLATEETALVAGRDRLRHIDSLFRALPLGKVGTLVPYLRVTLDRIVELDAAIHAKKAVLIEEEAWRARAAAVDDLRIKRDGLLAEQSRLVGKLAGLTEGEEKLTEGICPFLGERCLNLEGSDAVSVLPERKLALARAVDEAAAAVAAVDAELAEAGAAAREMEKFSIVRSEVERLENDRLRLAVDRGNHLRQLDPAGIAAELERWAEDHRLDDCRREAERLVCPDLSCPPAEQLTALDEWETRCHGVAAAVDAILAEMVARADGPLSAVQGERSRAESELREIERRLAELAEAGKRAADRRQVAARHLAGAETHEREARVLRERLKEYAGIDTAIALAEEERRASSADHERFLQSEPAARDLERRRETLERYRKRLEQLEREKVCKSEELAGLAATYSADDHAERQRQKEALHAREAALAESLRNLASNRGRLLTEIADLEKVEAEMKQKQDEVQDLRRKEELVKFLRNKVFKNVSAQLSERFREEITLRADRIYRTIAESDEELVWGDDYRIVLRDLVNGEVRERTDDQLSGGQTMSAVVALRLALLQTIGARLAFFDEPTSNLDAARRENLAQAFRAIDHGKEEVTEHWYDQLFLISHDVAFTEVTDQIIPLGE